MSIAAVDVGGVGVVASANRYTTTTTTDAARACGRGRGTFVATRTHAAVRDAVGNVNQMVMMMSRSGSCGGGRGNHVVVAAAISIMSWLLPQTWMGM